MQDISRALSPGERALAASIFGDAVDYDAVRIHRRKWFPFQPKRVIMAPDGHIWIHPESDLWQEDFSAAPLPLQALFVHEMTHVWQAQKHGKYYLLLMRHPFCRYAYDFEPDRPFERYGIEQQAEIVRHAFLLRQGAHAGTASLDSLMRTLPFAVSAAPFSLRA